MPFVTGTVASVAVTASGSGYTTAPTVSFAGGGGTGAAGTATIIGSVSALTLTASGTGYTTAPTVSFAGGGGTGSTATATLGGNKTQAAINAAWGNPPSYNLRNLNAGNRILFSPTISGNGEEDGSGTGPGVRIYCCFLGANIWTGGQTREDMVASANHEGTHCKQDYQAKTNTPGNNIYHLLDVEYGGVVSPGYVSFAEAETHLTELEDIHVGWFNAISLSQGDLSNFHNRFYTECVLARYPAMGAGNAKTAARQFLQGLYERIPWLEMKKDGYDYYVRPPN